MKTRILLIASVILMISSFHIFNYYPWAGLIMGIVAGGYLIFQTMKLINIIPMLAILLLASGCYNRVDPANEGVLVTNWGQDFPNDYAPVSGRVNTWGFGKDLYQVPMHEQQNEVPQFEIFASDGGKFSVDPDYTFEAIRGKGPQMLWKYANYRGQSEFLQNIADQLMDTRIRNRYKEIAGFYTTDSLMYNRVAFERQVEDSLKKDFESAYFKLIGIASGLEPPKSMQDAVERRNAAVQIAQQKQNELAAAEAEQKIRISNARADVEVAKLQAEANEARSRSLSQQLIQEQFIKKWDGKLHNTPIEEVIGYFRK